jgi:hypothetical protein
MELFADLALPATRSGETPSAWADVETPLGTLRPNVVVDNRPMTHDLPTEIRAISPTTTLYMWISEMGRAELLRLNLGSTLQHDVPSAGCVGFVWRIATWRPLDTLTVECRWELVTVDCEAKPVSGPGVDGRMWQGTDAVVAVGTEDTASMIRRAARNNGFPRRFAGTLGATNVVYREEGIEVAVPPLERHEQCQVQFVVAWAAARFAEATREAVTWDPTQLLAAAHR